MYLQSLGPSAYRVYSSFTQQELTRDNYVLTVFSGSHTWTGGHAAMFLEYFRFDTFNTAETIMIDLTMQGGAMKIRKDNVEYVRQIFGESGWELNQIMNLPKGGDPAQLANTNHRSYNINAAQVRALMRAVDRFSNKVQAGRYTYSAPGGALGYIGSTIGHRGINCADFILKVLNEAGIANRHNSVFNTPMRMAKPR